MYSGQPMRRSARMDFTACSHSSTTGSSPAFNAAASARCMKLSWVESSLPITTGLPNSRRSTPAMACSCAGLRVAA